MVGLNVFRVLHNVMSERQMTQLLGITVTAMKSINITTESLVELSLNITNCFQTIKFSVGYINATLKIVSFDCYHFDGLMQNYSVSIANALEIRQSGIKPLICQCC